jgi:hypothetical protein
MVKYEVKNNSDDAFVVFVVAFCIIGVVAILAIDNYFDGDYDNCLDACVSGDIDCIKVCGLILSGNCSSEGIVGIDGESGLEAVKNGLDDGCSCEVKA